MKSKFILFLIIQFAYAVDEGSIESNENNKKSDVNKNEEKSPENEERHKREGSPENAGSYERDEGAKNEVAAEDDTSSDSLFDNDAGMSKSVIYVETSKQTKPDSQNASNEFDDTRNVSLSGSDGLKETLPDTQSVFDPINFSPENGPSEVNKQSKLEENMNTEIQEIKAVDKLEDSESRKAFINTEQPGVSKSETSPINNTQSDNTQSDNSIKDSIPKYINIKNNTKSDIEDKEESLNDKKVFEIQGEEERHSSNTKDAENSKTPLTSKSTGIKEVNTETDVTPENHISKSKIYEGKTLSDDKKKDSSFDLKNGSSPDIVNKPNAHDNKNSGIDVDKSATMPLTDGNTLTQTIDNEGTSKDKDTEILNENPFDSGTKPLSLNDEHIQTNNIETDLNGKSQSSIKIETEGTPSEFRSNANPKGNAKEPSTVSATPLDIGTESSTDSSKDDETKIFNDKDVNVADHSSKIDRENDAKSVSSTKDDETTINNEDISIPNHLSKIDREREQNPGSSAKDKEPEINDKDKSNPNHSSEVDTENDAKSVSSTTPTEIKINLKDVNISGHFSKVDRERDTNLNTSTTATETKVNDKDISTANRSSEVDTDNAKNLGSSVATETKINDKEPIIADHSSEVDKNLSSKISSTKNNDSSINDKDVNVAGPSSASSDADTKPVLSPTDNTVTQDTSNNVDSSKGSSDGKINNTSGTTKDNTRKRFIKSFNDLQQYINAFNQGTSSIFTGGTASGKVDSNENNTQSVDKDINTSLIESELNFNKTPIHEAINNNNENITQNVDKDINIRFIESERSKVTKGTASGEVDNDTILTTPSINNSSNVNSVEDLINKNVSRTGNDNITSYLSNNSDLKINDNKGTDNDPIKINENIIVGCLDIMTSPRDQPSTSTSNNDESGYPIIESNNNDTGSNDTSSEEYVYERDSRLGTIDSESLSNSESDSFSSFVDSNDQNRLLLGGGMPLGNDRPQTNQPIRLKFTVSRS
jgi:hypothetical protein